MRGVFRLLFVLIFAVLAVHLFGGRYFVCNHSHLTMDVEQQEGRLARRRRLGRRACPPSHGQGRAVVQLAMRS